MSYFLLSFFQYLIYSSFLWDAIGLLLLPSNMTHAILPVYLSILDSISDPVVSFEAAVVIHCCSARGR